MNLDQTITTAPYNTMNLPSGIKSNLSNPNNPNNQIQNPRQSHRVPLGTETNNYDPTKQMVNDYLDTNISMYDNRGKYFDSYLFNQKFDEYIKQKTEERKLKEQVQLYDLDNIENIQVQPYELPINKLLINFKNLWFKLFDDLINKKDPTYLFTTTNFFLFWYDICCYFFIIHYVILYF